MTPKERALELVDKYRGLVISAPYTDSEDGSCISETMMLTRSAKQCALIAVDEIFEFMRMDDDFHEDAHFANSKWVNYFQQVKQEIEKI